MPDPAKSVGDIDDVLSSIRRLVAEQPGPKWRGQGWWIPRRRGAAFARMIRLVLTPALRVTESEPVAESWTSDAADGAGDMQPGSGDGTDHPDTDAADSHQDARIVGDAGWRPEMRLFDWEAAVAADDAANAERAGATSEFEPDTGDADWPGEGADRAVLDLAAARETGGCRRVRRHRWRPRRWGRRGGSTSGDRGHRLHADLLSAPRSSIGPCLGHDRYHRRADRGRPPQTPLRPRRWRARRRHRRSPQPPRPCRTCKTATRPSPKTPPVARQTRETRHSPAFGTRGPVQRPRPPKRPPPPKSRRNATRRPAIRLSR
jgi:hypothetical protein